MADRKSNGEENLIKKAIEEIQETKGNVQLTKGSYKKIQQVAGKRYYELNRLEAAMDGAQKNLMQLSGRTQVNGLERVKWIIGTCNSLRPELEREKSSIDKFGRIMEGLTRTETLSANGTQILYGSTDLYERNVTNLGIPFTPPSVNEKIDPYFEDQPEIVEELKKLLNGIDPELEDLYLGAKDIFETPIRSRLEAASSNIRTLIWEIYRKLAPHDKVTSAAGFKQIKDDPKLATYRQRIAFILTGTAEIDAPDTKLIDTVFKDLNEALSLFSAKSKAVNKNISDYQVKKTMAQCERALFSLLKNRKI